MTQNNPYEMDMDVDEETGEVILPAGYTGRHSNPFGLNAERNIGQVDQRMVRGPLAPAQNAQPADSAPAATNTRTVTRHTATVLTPADCPACPPCPRAPGRMRSPEGSLLGLVIGLGLVGGVLWYSGKMATEMGEAEGDLDELIASLPPGAPKMLAANVAGSDEEE